MYDFYEEKCDSESSFVKQDTKWVVLQEKNPVESAIYGSEFAAPCTATDQTMVLRYHYVIWV